MKKKIIFCFLSAFIIFSSSLNSFAFSPNILMSTIYAIGKVVATSTKVVIDAEGILSLGYKVYNFMTIEQQEDLREEDLYNNGEFVITEDFYNKVNEYAKGKVINMKYNLITDMPVRVDYSVNLIQEKNAHLSSVVEPIFNDTVKGNPLYRTFIYAQGTKIELYSAGFYSTNENRPIIYGCLKIGDTYTNITSNGWIDLSDNIYLEYYFRERDNNIYFYLKCFNDNEYDSVIFSSHTYPIISFGNPNGVNTTINTNNINKDSLNNKFTYSELEEIKDVYPNLELRPKEELDKPSTPPGGNDPGGNDPGGNDPIITNPPSFPNLQEFDFSGLQLEPLTNLFSNFKNKFPFSLPFDLSNLIGGLKQEPIPPIFETELLGETMTLDLTQFSELANLVRMFTVLSYVIGLVLLTKRFGG